MTAHPGAFCGPAGAVDETIAGTPMVCSVGDKPGRARWRRNGPAPARTPRRRGRAAKASAGQLPQVDAGINPTAVQHTVPEAADTQTPKADLRNTPHESDRTGPDADCTRCGLPAANGVHTNSARHPQWLNHKDLVERAGGPIRPGESLEDYDARLAPFRNDDDPAKSEAAKKPPMTDDEIADKMRQVYGDKPGQWMTMKDVADKSGLTADEIARGTRRLLNDDNSFRAEPEPFGHRVQAEHDAVSPVIGGEARHNIKFGAAGDPKLLGAHTTGSSATTPPSPTVQSTPKAAPATPPANRPASTGPVDGHYTERQPKPNNWGEIPHHGAHTIHYDGRLPRGVDSLGPDGRIDMGGGEPLADTILDLGDQVRAGNLHPSELPERLAAVRDRLPKNSSAYRTVSQMADAVDAPMTAVPYVPEGTPEPLRHLVGELHRIPLCRQDPDRELNKVADLAKRLAAGEINRRDVEQGLYRMNRHEMWSDTGSIQINDMVRDTMNALRRDRRGR